VKLPFDKSQAVFALAIALACGPGATSAAGKAPAPFVVASPRYEDAPEPWRTYLAKARAADAIKDPIERCLGFPPFPGSQWPANLLPAHCQWAFGLDEYFTLANLRTRIEAKDFAGIEEHYRALQERHFSESDFSEHIHQAFNIFDSSYDAGALSKRWLDAAPDSPFAMTARADFYRNMGWAARGGAWAQETADEQFQRLEEFHTKAATLYVQALKLEPRLMHAYAGLEDMAMNGRRLDKDAIFDAAMKIDPACKWFLDQRMTALQPRWGGSYKQMGELEQQMLPNLARRPLLSLSRIWPYEDLRNLLYAAERYEEAAKVLKPMIAVSSSPQVYEDLAESLDASKDANRWEELAYLVESTRFRPGDGWHARERGRLQMLSARDAEMANRSLAEAVKVDPDDYFGHYLYAASFSRLGKIDEAEREYLIAMRDKPGTGNHRDSLFELAEMMTRAHRGEKLKAYAKQALAEYPVHARSWIAHAHALAIDGRTDMQPLREALEKILAYGDPTDPRMNAEMEYARRGLDGMRAAVEKSGGKW
jgi:tetratricopeptide (TPR) repeat protein